MAARPARLRRELDGLVVAAAHDLDLGALAPRSPRSARPAVPAGTRIRAASPSSDATCATARPWLPSVAVTSVTSGCSAAIARSSANVAAGSSRPARALSARQTAHDAPSTLNAGRPKRSTSIFTTSRSSPRCSATPGASASGARPVAGHAAVKAAAAADRRRGDAAAGRAARRSCRGSRAGSGRASPVTVPAAPAPASRRVGQLAPIGVVEHVAADPSVALTCWSFA